MSERTKGKCKYCGKEYTKGYMVKHLSACKERKSRLMEENGSKKCGYYELIICSKYISKYWLIVEVRENVTLKDLDSFLRDIWLECCGHLSAFDIYGTSYELMPDKDAFWGPPAKSMNYQLKTLLEPGMTIGYEYDFGSTTELVIDVKNYREGYWKKEKITILSRNNPLEYMCSYCHKNTATLIYPEGFYDGTPFLCEECYEEMEDEDLFVLDVCNSPRMGVCGYNGSDIYPEQFEPDKYL